MKYKEGAMKRVFSIAIIALFAVAFSYGGQRPMSIDDLFAIKRVSDPRISPDGRRVAFVVTVADFKENRQNSDVWIAEAGGEPWQLTAAPKKDERPRWSPDGRHIAFISDRSGKDQVWLIRADGGEAFKLTESEEEVKAFAWAPDGGRIYYTAAEPLDEAAKKRREETAETIIVDRDFRNSHLWSIDIDSRRTKQLTKGDFHIREFAISPDGRRAALICSPTPRVDDSIENEIFLLDLEEGKLPVGQAALRRLTRNRAAESELEWSPSGAKLIFEAASDPGLERPGQSRLFLIDMAESVECLTPDFRGAVHSSAWLNDKTICLTASLGANSNLYSLSPETKKLEPLTRGEQVIDEFTLAPPQAAALLKQDPASPPDVYLARLDGAAELERLTSMNRQISELQLGRYETVRYKSKDGVEVEGLLVYPVNYRAGEKYPLVVQLHGGPASAYMNIFPSSYGTYTHILAGRGYAVFQPNYRGSTGYGDDFMRQIYGNYFGPSIDDILAGVDHLIERGIADAERLGVMGWSAGGHMTNWLITHTDRFKAAASGAGVANWVSLYSQTDIRFIREVYLNGTPWDNLDHYIKESPLTYIKNARTPTLILFGEKDERIPLPQGRELYMGLIKNGVTAELVIFPREPHGLREPRHQRFKVEKELEWFEKHLSATSALKN